MKCFGHAEIQSNPMRAFLVAQSVKNPPAVQKMLVPYLVEKIPWEIPRIEEPDGL